MCVLVNVHILMKEEKTGLWYPFIIFDILNPWFRFLGNFDFYIFLHLWKLIIYKTKAHTHITLFWLVPYFNGYKDWTINLCSNLGLLKYYTSKPSRSHFLKYSLDNIYIFLNKWSLKIKSFTQASEIYRSAMARTVVT